MAGPSVSSQGYTLPGVTPLDIRTPAARGEAAATQTPAPAATANAAAAPSLAPGFVVEFPQGLAGGYVLDYRDPKTNTVLVQVPMRSAFTQMEGAATPEHVGKLVDTTV
jgi:hypothetical protein